MAGKHLHTFEPIAKLTSVARDGSQGRWRDARSRSELCEELLTLSWRHLASRRSTSEPENTCLSLNLSSCSLLVWLSLCFESADRL